MLKSVNNLLLLSATGAGILISLGATQWYSAWLGLEVGLISFLPLILTSLGAGDSPLKYFLVQACASMGLIQGLLLLPPALVWLLVVPLALKAGLAPLHFWFPAVANALPWSKNMVLFTVQKVTPLYLIASLQLPAQGVIFLSASSVFVGAVGGINELSLRKMMAFSSISHMGWAIAALTLSLSTAFLYIIVYFFTTTTAIMSMMMNRMNLTQEVAQTPKSYLQYHLFSLSGFPPLLGFYPKWSVLNGVSSSSATLAISLIISSIITFYFYMKVATVATIVWKKSTKPASPPKTKMASVLLNTVSFFGIPVAALTTSLLL